MKQSDKIFVAGHGGLVGSAIVRRLRSLGFNNLLLRTREELDLRDHAATRSLFEAERPRYVFFAAAKVGGILANQRSPADFICDNLAVQTGVIEASHVSGVNKLLFLGSSCAYPKHAEQPIREEALLTGPLEPTNEAYAVAKIAGIVMCQSFNRQHGTRYISAMPTNLYGENDSFEGDNSHVLPALIRRFHEAKTSGAQALVVWGTGAPRREFMYVDDMANACVHLMRHWAERDASGIIVGGADAVNQIVNVGSGEEVTIRELAEVVKDTVGFSGEIRWDHSKPDGTPRKLLDTTRLRSTGWRPSISLHDGIRRTYDWYVRNYACSRGDAVVARR